MNKRSAEIVQEMRRIAAMSGDKRPVYIVEGPPGSGKSTYTREHKQPGDIVLDLDALASALLGDTSAHPDYSPVMDAVLAAREAIYKTIENRQGKWKSAYIITSNPERSAVDQLANRLGASIVTMNLSMEQCKEQIEKDQTRTNPQNDVELAEKWYSTRGY